MIISTLVSIHKSTAIVGIDPSLVSCFVSLCLGSQVSFFCYKKVERFCNQKRVKVSSRRCTLRSAAKLSLHSSRGIPRSLYLSGTSPHTSLIKLRSRCLLMCSSDLNLSNFWLYLGAYIVPLVPCFSNAVLYCYVIFCYFI